MTTEEVRADTVTSTQRWLEDIGLARYATVFAENRIDLDVLRDLTEGDLAELGVALGDRKRLLRAAASLEAPPASGSPAGRGKTVTRPAAAERRHLTVMFCDMVGSTALSEQFDPEDLRDTIAAYRETCARVVDHYEGFVANYIGDGIVVFFGYPKAHEDDAERAVRAGLEIVGSFARELTGPAEALRKPLEVRIGIATGLVVVGDVIGAGTEERHSAVGETPNLAARLQALAPPNGVIIAGSTRSLLGTKFELKDLGSHALKGVSAPVQAWCVVRPRHLESRFASTADAKLTPLVNREEEIALLLRRWQQAKEGEGQVVLLAGEPGIGKSRIIQEFRERIANDPHGSMSFQCSPYYTSTAFYPFVEHLKSVLGIDRDAPGVVTFEELKTTLAAMNDSVEPEAGLLAALLLDASSHAYKPLNLPPQRQKEETLAALANLFVGLARAQSAVMIVEDAHWIDPSSREVLDLLVDRIQNFRILLLLTCRPEFQPSWNAQSHITTLTLNRLSRQLRAAMVEHVAGAMPIPEEVIKEITLKTDGVPLFVEELTKAVLESNILSEKDGRYVLSGPLRPLAIPATLNDSLMARLDRMASYKEVAQIGATIGREFSYGLLREVAESPISHLNLSLRKLEEADLIIRRGHPLQATYVFKHALVQDAAYSTLLHRDRRKLHAKIAAVLVENYPEKAEREPELLAHHFTEAGQSEPAVRFWLKAGKRAAKTRANLEAIAHLRRGLEVLEGSPNLPDRDSTELELRIALGVLLIAARGYAVREVEDNYMRALELSQKLDDNQIIFQATRGLWVCYFIRADLHKAYELSLTLLKLAELADHGEPSDGRRQGTGHLIEAHRAVGMTLFWRARFAESRDYLERGIGLYDMKLHGVLSEIHGIDPGIVSLTYLGYVMWFLGNSDQAREYTNQALCNAEKMRHPFTLAFASIFRAYVCQHLRNVEGTREYANRAMAISVEHGFLFWKYQATMLGGWARAELGQAKEGLNQIRAGLDAYEETESKLASPWFRILLADAYVRAGRQDAALLALDEAFVMIERTGERSFLAEIYRLQGQIGLIDRGAKAELAAEHCFQRSLEISRKQGALAWELRTSVSLARLWRDAGRRRDAAELLAPICGRFKQGFDTLDVKEALELLGELQA